jgi:hypothetical protein
MQQKIKDAAVFVGSIIAVIWGVIQIYNWVSAPSSDVQAIVRYGPLQTPPFAERAIISLKQLLNSPAFQTSVKTDFPRFVLESGSGYDKGYDAGIRWTTQAVLNKLPSPSPGPPVGGYYSISVINSGSRSISNVTLRIPYCSVVRVSKDGVASQLIDNATEGAQIVRLDTLQVRENVHVFAWVTLEPVNPSEIVLSHDGGLGRVRYLVPLGPLAQWADTLIPPIIGTGMVILLMLAIQIAAFHLGKRNARKRTSPPSEPSS